ncbi:MAG: hypothetical protein WBB85_01890 [Albidovulum sp.]|uniref:hypothetical protein n=1 Tax=Albidovulum sp. TaxID=1872424 RepID=UPI003CBED918
MNAQRLITMIINTVTRRLINLGINKGIDLASRKGKPRDQMTAEDRKQAKNAREIAKRARQAAKITRRLGR